MKMECGRCGARYAGDFERQWGKTEETNGHGSQARCVALVPNGHTATNRQGDSEPALELCRGQVVYVPDDAERDKEIAPLSPISLRSR